MTHYGHFTRYSPEGGENALCFLSEDGLDWHTLTRGIVQWNDRGQFVSSATGETFLLVDPTHGTILSVTQDLSRFTPENLDVYGFDPNDVPENALGMALINGEIVEHPYIAPPIPQAVTMRQAKLMLLRVGILSAANAIIEGMEGEAGEEARIEWNFASDLERAHPLVTQLGVELNLPAEQIDSLFLWASAL